MSRGLSTHTSALPQMQDGLNSPTPRALLSPGSRAAPAFIARTPAIPRAHATSARRAAPTDLGFQRNSSPGSEQDSLPSSGPDQMVHLSAAPRAWGSCLILGASAVREVGACMAKLGFCPLSRAGTLWAALHAPCPGVGEEHGWGVTSMLAQGLSPCSSPGWGTHEVPSLPHLGSRLLTPAVISLHCSFPRTVTSA